MPGKIAKLIEILKTGENNIDELVAKSGASKNTIKMQVKFLLKKKGFEVKSREVNGVVVYSL